MGLKLKKVINQNFAWLPSQKISDLFMSHTHLSGTSMQKTRQFGR
jgi:hypothetical protein